MKVRCSQESLYEAISIVSKAVSPRSAIVVMEGIYLRTHSDNELILTGNDFDLGIECTIDAQVEREGEIVLNSKLFGNYVRLLSDGIVDIEVVNESNAIIRSGNSKYEVGGIVATEFPELPSFDAEYSMQLDRISLKSMINNTIFSVGINSSKVVFTGCLLALDGANVKMVGIDGYRMAIRTETVDGDYEKRSAIIPAKALIELNKIIKDSGDIEINYTQKHAVFLFDNCKVVTRLIEGTFVDYENILPKSAEIIIKVNSKQLAEIIERVSVINSSDINKSPLVMYIKEDELQLSCETTAGKTLDYLPIDNRGSELRIGFNYRYLLDALRACGDDNVILKFNGTNDACSITPVEGNEFYYFILPLRMS